MSFCPISAPPPWSAVGLGSHSIASATTLWRLYICDLLRQHRINIRQNLNRWKTTQIQSTQNTNCTNVSSGWIPGHYLDTNYGIKCFCSLFWGGSFNWVCCVQSFINIWWKSVGKWEIKSHSGWYALMRKHVFEFQIKLSGLQKTHISNSHIRGHLPGKQLTFHLLYLHHWRIRMLTTADICLLTPFPPCTSSSQTRVLFS